MISNARNIINAEARMEEFIYSVVRSRIGQLNYSEIVSESDENSSRGNLNDRVTKRVNEFLDHGNYGIEVVDVRMKRIDLPQENEQSIYTRMISERQSTAQDLFITKGMPRRSRIEAETDREVQEMLALLKKMQLLFMQKGKLKLPKYIMILSRKIPNFIVLYRTLQSYSRTIGEDTVIIMPADSPYARSIDRLYRITGIGLRHFSFPLAYHGKINEDNVFFVYY